MASKIQIEVGYCQRPTRLSEGIDFYFVGCGNTIKVVFLNFYLRYYNIKRNF